MAAASSPTPARRNATSTRCRPTRVEQLARAVELFNHSEHAKMLAGVIQLTRRSLHCASAPSHEELVVEILIAWELC